MSSFAWVVNPGVGGFKPPEGLWHGLMVAVREDCVAVIGETAGTYIVESIAAVVCIVCVKYGSVAVFKKSCVWIVCATCGSVAVFKKYILYIS